MTKFTKISEVVAHMGLTFTEAWPYMAGQQCRLAHIAERLGEALEVKPASLMLGASRVRLRGNVLTLFANDVQTDRYHLCEILRGKRSPSADLANRLAAVTGVPAQAWLEPDKHHNPVLVYVRKNNAGRSKKPLRALRMTPERAPAAGNA